MVTELILVEAPGLGVHSKPEAQAAAVALSKVREPRGAERLAIFEGPAAEIHKSIRIGTSTH